MRLFSSTGEPAVLGVGAEANAIIAVGQFARGFIAVGQVAIGVFALGQLCVAVVGLGQAGCGIAWFSGMLGFGGRGLCLRLIPGIDPPRVTPATVPFEAIAQGAPGAEGLVRVDLVDGRNGPALGLQGSLLPVKPTPPIVWGLANARRAGVKAILAHIKRAGGVLVCDRLVEIPRTRSTFGLPFQAARIALLCLLGCAWWYAFAWMKMGS